jgi:DNA-binding transcriptional ArsR family regulator
MKLRRDIFQALSDPTRRTILVLLASQAMTAGAIANNFDAARPTISKHLQILNECDLIEANKQGREIYYELKIEKMKEVDKWLEQFRKIWENRFDQLDKVLSNLKNQKK